MAGRGRFALVQAREKARAIGRVSNMEQIAWPRHRPAPPGGGRNVISADGRVDFLPNAQVKPGLHMPHAGSDWEPAADSP